MRAARLIFCDSLWQVDQRFKDALMDLEGLEPDHPQYAAAAALASKTYYEDLDRVLVTPDCTPFLLSKEVQDALDDVLTSCYPAHRAPAGVDLELSGGQVGYFGCTTGMSKATALSAYQEYFSRTFNVLQGIDWSSAVRNAPDERRKDVKRVADMVPRKFRFTQAYLGGDIIPFPFVTSSFLKLLSLQLGQLRRSLDMVRQLPSIYFLLIISFCSPIPAVFGIRRAPSALRQVARRRTFYP